MVSERRIAPGNLNLFERLVFAWLFVHALCYFQIKDLLWGHEALLMTPNTSQSLFNNLYYILSYNLSLAKVVYFAHLIGAFVIVTGLLRRVFWMSSAIKGLVYLSGYMLYFSAWPNFNAGFLLMLNYAFFTIFILHGNQSWKVVVSNFARLACVMMLLFVYAESSAYKIAGDYWLDGSAVYYAISLDQYSHEWSQNFILNNLWLVPILTYGALIYQILFPFVVWFKKIKWPFLTIGIIFHLFIALGMGLWDFGTAMLIGYVLFMDEKRIQWMVPSDLKTAST
jgi:hypothetical protein